MTIVYKCYGTFIYKKIDYLNKFLKNPNRKNTQHQLKIKNKRDLENRCGEKLFVSTKKEDKQFKKSKSSKKSKNSNSKGFKNKNKGNKMNNKSSNKKNKRKNKKRRGQHGK